MRHCLSKLRKMADCDSKKAEELSLRILPRMRAKLKITLVARGLEEPCASFPDLLFSGQYLICRHVWTDRKTELCFRIYGWTDRQTDRQTDGRINPGKK